MGRSGVGRSRLGVSRKPESDNEICIAGLDISDNSIRHRPLVQPSQVYYTERLIIVIGKLLSLTPAVKLTTEGPRDVQCLLKPCEMSQKCSSTCI